MKRAEIHSLFPNLRVFPLALPLIRYIHEMLGHVELSTTQIYTQVSIRRLKTVHSLTHPSAKIDKPTTSTSDVGVEGIPSLAADVKHPLLNTKALEDLAAVVDGDVKASRAAVKTEAAAAKLMAALAVEAAEEGG